AAPSASAPAAAAIATRRVGSGLLPSAAVRPTTASAPARSNQPPGAWRTPYGRESRGEWFQRGAALRERLATSQRRDGRAGGGRRAGLRVAGGAPPSVPRNPTRRARRSAERTAQLKERTGARTKTKSKGTTGQ